MMQAFFLRVSDADTRGGHSICILTDPGEMAHPYQKTSTPPFLLAGNKHSGQILALQPELKE